MIRLVRSIYSSIQPIHLCFPFSDRTDNKNDQKHFFRKPKDESNVNMDFHHFNNNKSSTNKQSRKIFQLNLQKKQKQSSQMGTLKLHKKQNKKIPQPHHDNIPKDSLKPQKQIGLEQIGLPPQQQSALEKQWAQTIKIQDEYERGFAIKIFLSKLMLSLPNLQSPLPKPLTGTLMHYYFFESSHKASLSYENFIKLKNAEIAILSSNSEIVRTFYSSSSNINQKIHFYFNLQKLLSHCEYATLQQLKKIFNYCFTQLESIFSGINFAQVSNQDVIKVFQRRLKYSQLSSSDERLVRSICSQIPFFSQNKLWAFLFNHCSFFMKADFNTILNVLDIVQMQGFSQISLQKYDAIIKSLAIINRKHYQIEEKAVALFKLLLKNLLESQAKHPTTLIFSVLLPLSKHIDLKDTSVAPEFFRFLKEQIKNLPLGDDYTAKEKGRQLFKNIKYLIQSQFFERRDFSEEMSELKAKAEIILKSRSKLDDFELQFVQLLSSQVGDRFNFSIFRYLSARKQLRWIMQIIKLADWQMLVDLSLSMLQFHPHHNFLNFLRLNLSQQEYKQTLNKINQFLLRRGSNKEYYYLFINLFRCKNFKYALPNLLESLQELQQNKEDQYIIMRMVLTLLFKKEVKIYDFARYVSQVIYVLGFYTNNPLRLQRLLSTDSFFYLLHRMVGIFSFNSDDQLIKGLKISIYQLLDLVFKSPHHLKEPLFMAIRNFSIAKDNHESYKKHVDLQALERTILMFQLNLLITQQNVFKIYTKVIQQQIQATPAQKACLQKLNDRNWQPDVLSKDTLVAFLMDQNMMELLEEKINIVQQIIKEASGGDLVFYLNYFSIGKKSMATSQLFKRIWSAFLERMDQKTINQFMFAHFLSKFGHIADQFFLPFLLKMLPYYTKSPYKYHVGRHFVLFKMIRQKFPAPIELPQQVQSYVASVRRYIKEIHIYIKRIYLTTFILQLLQLGFGINQDEIPFIDPLIQNDIFFEIIIVSEQTIPQQMPRLLERYLKLCISRKGRNITEVNAYIIHKYPQFTHLIEKIQGPAPSLKDDFRKMQVYCLEMMCKQYKNLIYHQDMYCVIYKNHLITFCPTNDRPFQLLQKKFYQLKTANQNMEIHLFNISDFNTSNFQVKIAALGIEKTNLKAQYIAMKQEQKDIPLQEDAYQLLEDLPETQTEKLF